MDTLDLKSYFKKVGYDYTKDLEQLGHVLALTKTRNRPNLAITSSKAFYPTYGMEQPFFIKAVAEHLGASSFFEIGTGRGTASYAVSLVSTISKITTVDITPFDKKINTAINYRPAAVSNKDIFEMIKFPEKKKIDFKHTSNYPLIRSLSSDCYDLCFIDGCHEKAKVITEDFNMCLHLIKDGGYIIWDDYDPNRFKVKEVVDSVIDKHGYSSELIEFRGHLFGTQNPERNAGEVLMKITK